MSALLFVIGVVLAEMDKDRTIDVFCDINNLFINNIIINRNSMCDFIEEEIFDDFIETYSRAYKMILNNKLIDGMVILRSSFELMLTLFGIRIDPNVKNEYCREDSYERYLVRRKINRKEKNYTSQDFLRKLIPKNYPNIEADYFKIYNALSKYAHPTIHRNEMRFFEREKVDVTILNLSLALLIPIIFLELLCEQGIITKEKYEDLSIFRYIIDRLTALYLIRNGNKKQFSKAKIYLFTDVNNEFNQKQIKNMKSDIINTEELIKENNEELKAELYNTLSKADYYDIAKKLLELGIS